jgi:ATP-dependent helicase/nuclease subunit A
VTTLTDEDDRKRIRTDTSATLFVEAGAGTGKTTALVDRIATLVADGHAPLSTIGAITFTEAAAAQLRERIRLRLERLVADADERPDRRGRAATGLDELDDAPLLTLHGFANRILSAHAVEAGLPPGFEVRDAIEANVDFDRRWRAFVAGLVNDPAADEVLRAALGMLLTVDHLKQVARQLHESWDLVQERPPLPPVDLAAIAAPLDAAFAAAYAWIDRCTDPGDKLLAFLRSTLPAYQRELAAGLAAAGDHLPSVAAVLAGRFPRPGGIGSTKAWPVAPKVVRDDIVRVDDARQAVRRAVAQRLLGQLLPHLVRFTLAGVDERAAIGALEYHDLLVRARRLLRHDPAVRASVKARYRYLLVDEFQDTDPLQVDLAVLAATTATGPLGDDRDWQDLDVEPGRLFFVGDPKQSIYRFRRADIELYGMVRDALGRDRCPLVTNWRSSPPIIDAVNAAFGPWFVEQGAGQAPWADLVAGRALHAGGGNVVVLGGEIADRSAEEVREVAATEVAATIHAAVAQGWPVTDPKVADGVRAPRLDDITVLLPTRTALPALERALTDAGLAYRVEARSLVWATQEVRDLLSVVRAVADPGDQVAAVAALTSGVLACSWEELRQWRVGGGTWSHTVVPPAELRDHPVGRAMAALRAWAADARWTEPAALLERIVRERAVLESAFARTRRREAWNRVRVLIEEARAWTSDGNAGLTHFADWADRQKDEQAQALESVVPEADDEAVRILTIHSAKGLEFPITIVAGLNVKRFGLAVSPATVLWGRHGSMEVSCGAKDLNLRTLGFDALASVDDELNKHELTRLLYVACTRAKEHLVISVHRKAGSRDENSAAADLDARLLPLDGLLRGIEAVIARPPGPFARRPVAPPSAAIPDPASVMAELSHGARRRSAARALSARRAAVSATAVAHDDAPGQQATLDLGPVLTPAVEPVPAPGAPDVLAELVERPGSSGTVLGLAVHAALEHIAFDAPDHEVVRVAEEAAAVAGADPVATADAVRAALGSSAVKAALAADRTWRELFVAAPVEGLVVEGFVDLLHTDDAGNLVIVDWKTDRVVDDADRRAKADTYAVQLATYALALEATVPQRVARVTLVFCGHGAAHQVDLEGDELRRACDRARERVATIRDAPEAGL